MDEVSLSPGTFLSRPPLADAVAVEYGNMAAPGRMSAALSPPPIGRADPGQQVPLSFQQERAWFLQQLVPTSLAYHAHATIRLRGPLIRPVLEAALGEIVRRHEILRTAFRSVDEMAAADVRPPMPVRVPVIDLAGLPEQLAAAQAEEAVLEAMRGIFDLAKPPLVRWLLVRLSASDHLLVQVAHQLVYDGWSLTIFLDELQAIYEAFAQGRPSPLPEPGVQYSDFAVWQRQWLRHDVLRQHLEYWTGQLAGAPTVLDLPTDRHRPAAQSFRGSALRIDLPSGLCRQLRAFSRQRGVPLFTTMLAVFATLLGRYTGQEDLLIGSDVANRRLAEAERLIGMVANTVVLRIGLSGEPCLDELLSRVQETLAEASNWQDAPLDQLVDALAPARDAARSPLFQVMFSSHDTPGPELDFAGLHGTVLERHNGSAKTDLSVMVAARTRQRTGLGPLQDDAPITLIWEYASELFDETTMRRMVAHYQHLLGAAMRAPDRAMARLLLLSAAEERLVLKEWNTGDVPYDADRVIHELVDEHAVARPDAVAVIDAGTSLTYGELSARANRLAHLLRRHGAGCDVPVGILLERGAEMIVAILAVLKAGGAYLPLGPAYPAERLAQMVTGVAPLVVTRSDLAARLPAGAAVAVKLDEQDDALAHEPATCPEPGAGPRNLACVLYTSGSTGRPKGVMVEHRGVLRLVRGTDYMEFGPGERFAQLSDASFDALTFEVWGALLHGGTVCVIPAVAVLTPGRLGQELRRHAVTSMFITSALFNEVMAAHPDSFAGLANLIVGGEALNPGRIRELAGGPWAPRRLLNGYGPTETTTFAACHLIEGVPPGASCVPIGRGIANTPLYVLDPHLQLVPVGVPGELHIGGPGVARGYVNQPGLTAERFVPDPFTAGGSRMYRTGDIVRWRPGGVIEFLGRVDDQVKIRGFRVEPGDVQAALEDHPSIAQAAVTAHEDATGRHLVAYVVPGARMPSPTSRELRAFLAGRLPPYLLPAAYVYLGALPLTSHGKVDFAALARSDGARGELPSDHQGARTATEQRLAGLWAELLGTDQVGIHDNFFEMGGHSLLAMRLITQVNQEYGTNVALGRFLRAPTVALLAAEVDKDTVTDVAQPEIRDTSYALSYLQQRLWFLDQLGPRCPVYNVPLGYRVRGPLDVPALGRALSEVVRRHEVLRTVLRAADGAPRQIVLPPGPVTIQVVDLRNGTDPERAAERIATEQARTPFDLAAGPLLRPLLLRLGTESYRLCLTMHHVVCDGWSVGLLARELSALYQAYQMGLGSPLAELPLQYAEFSQWQLDYHRCGTLDSLLGYWREELAGIPELASLPTDHSRPPVQSYRGAHLDFGISAETAARVFTLARQTSATPFAVLLAAFAALLLAYLDGDEVVVGVPVAGRPRAEFEGLIGFFANTLVLRLRLEGERTFADLVRRVWAQTSAAVAHQDLSFEKLVDELRPARSLAHNPLFQLFFSYYEEDPQGLRLPGCDIEPAIGDSGTAKFDISLDLTLSAGALSGRLEYSTDLFDAETMRRLAEHYVELLASAVAEPGALVSTLPRLTGADEKLLTEWNTTGADLGAPATLPALTAAQAARTPGADAVCGADGWASYAEFGRRVNRLARLLRSYGARTGDVIGVFLEAGANLVLAVHAVHSAGGAYLPLDPGNPDKRLAFMASDSVPRLIITTSALAGRAAALNARLVMLDTGAAAIAAQDSGPLGIDVPHEALAYVIYTSGSTGIPKGVGISHRAIVNRLRWMQQAFPLGPEDRVLHKTPFSFDVSVWELFWPLMTGAGLVVAPPGGQQDPACIIGLLRDRQITIMHCVPSMLDVLLDEPGLAGQPTSLRKMICSGEPLPATLAARFHAALPGVELHNLYGPTEAAVDVSWHACTPGEDPIPIGAPIANTTLEVLDSRARRVPVGVPGELCIGGVQLARGYLGRPALTARRFIPDPFAREPGARLYRTGDLARWRRSGELEFLGRLDHQVKLRGNRIELGEIEAALAAHPGVRAAVATVYGQGAAQGIAAYCVPAAGGPAGRAAAMDGIPAGVSARALLDFARESLPGYMVPSAVILMDELPMTSNGKVDRRALPHPRESGQEDARSGFQPPGSWLERDIAEVWGELLGLDRIGIDDNFFDLGGNSLIAAKARIRLQARWSRELSLVDMFRYPTVASLAATVAGDPADSEELSGVERSAGSRVQAIARQAKLRRERRPR